MNKACRSALLFSVCFLLFANFSIADVNVLIIGSTHDSSERFGGTSAAFPPGTIATYLNNILGAAGLGTVNVTVRERYATATSVLGHGHSAYNLASWFHWPYPSGAESNRWADLRGEAGIVWDYVVLIPDPYTIEKMPGLYAYGAEQIAEEVAKGSAETILFMPWPNGTGSSVAHYEEMVYRAGRSGGYTVAPAGLAWNSVAPKPTGNDAAYLAAATIYSSIYGLNAKNTGYSYNASLADSAYTTVTNSLVAQHYSGAITFQNPFLFRTDTERNIYWSSHGTSTEDGFNKKIGPAIDRCNVGRENFAPWNNSWSAWTNNGGDTYWTLFPAHWPTPIAFNVGRDPLTSEPYKGYIINPTHWTFAFPYYYQVSTWSYPVADANDHFVGQMGVQDFDMADRMLTEGNSGRGLPLRTMWAQIHQEFPNENPLRDGSGPHLNYFEDEAVGSYIYTLYSGRCPMDKKPAGVDMNWVSRKIGYETAWKLGRCQMRAPGFKVMPRTATAKTVTTSTVETITVQFILPPRSNVTVRVAVDNPNAVIVNPHTLYFTTNNYDTAQTVSFRGLPGATTNDVFNVLFSTSSGDEVYKNLSDSWAYSTVRTVTQATVINEKGTNSVTCGENIPLTITPGVTGISSNNTVMIGPLNGSTAWSGTNIVYTPNFAYLGPDSFAYSVHNGSTVTRGYVAISVVPSTNKSVTVISAKGGASPGSMSANSGTALSFFITNSPVISGGTTNYTAAGGTVAGNTYTQVNPTNITLTLTNSCTLTWAWTTNYWLAVSAVGSGSVNVTNAWHASGTSVVVTATGTNSWVFTGWNGTTSGCIIAGNVLTAPMTNARSITANFESPVPVVNNSAGAINQTASSATLQGLLSAGISANAWICWGTSDAGTAGTGGWQKVISIGAVTQNVAFETNVTGLATNVTYWYRCYATNANGTAWSASAAAFNVTPAMGVWVPWTPTELAPQLWLDGSTATINAGTVSVVNAGSGGGIISGPAALAANGIGSLQAVQFDGVSRYLAGTYANTGATMTAFFVGKSLNATQIAYAGMMDVWANGQASDWNNVGSAVLFGQNNTTANSIYGYRNSAGLSAATGTLTSPFLAASVFDGAVNTLFLNGTAATGVASTGNFSAGNLTLGARKNVTVTNTWWNGNFGEAIICNTNLSTTDRQKIEGYLAHKWGLAGSLPAGHPYLSQAPGVIGEVINNRPPTGITGTNATFNAGFSATGTNYTVYVYWGASNGGTNSGAWANNLLLGVWTNVVNTNISHKASGLGSGTSYYYAFRAYNAGSNVWAQPSWRFTTPGSVTATTNHVVPYVWLASQNPGWSTNYEAAATNDPDSDGYSTWEEYWSGTDPLNSNSFLKIEVIYFDATGTKLQWQHADISGSLPAIAVQARTNMTLGSWTNVALKIPTNGPNIWSGSASQQLYYRLAVTNAP